MASIVEELQTLAYDSAVPIADLLRRMKVAATKLGLSGTVAWVETSSDSSRAVSQFLHGSEPRMKRSSCQRQPRKSFSLV